MNPLIQNRQKLIPSVTRVFGKARDLYVYLQAYLRGESNAQPVVAYVTLFSGQAKVFESQPMEVTPELNSRLGMTPLSFSIPLNAISPGEYDCQVTVLDPTGQKGTFWQAPIIIVP